MGEMKERFAGSSTYIADEDLLQVVNIAMELEKPLVIKGEPGTGKTELAIAVSEALNMPLITWSIKSTTKAQDGLYNYDVVRRLYDSQLGQGDVEDISAYIELGKLGEAFDSDERVVLLIDEIDKADLEFPNDLLWELDKMEFDIPETKQTVKAKKAPLVIMTSNSEKELPDPFLRRCAFHYIDFPDEELMRRIVLAHYPDAEEEVLDHAINAFYSLRDVEGIRKKPSTSELLDWVRALRISKIDSEKIEEELPYIGLLLKKNEDINLVKSKKGNI